MDREMTKSKSNDQDQTAGEKLTREELSALKVYVWKKSREISFLHQTAESLRPTPGPAVRGRVQAALVWLFSASKPVKKILAPLLTYLIKRVLHHPHLKLRLLNYVKHYPSLFERLRGFAKNRNLLLNGVVPVSNRATSLTAKSRFHGYLQEAMSAAKQSVLSNQDNPSKQRLKLALVSPLPPQRTGIANYSAALLPMLAKYYDIEIITEPDGFERWQQQGYSVRTPDWLCENFYSVDRVIYHFGNSAYHCYMLPLLEKAPGVVVLHDFFLSGLLSYLELGGNTDIWSQELYHAHGYKAVKERFMQGKIAHTQINYPVNLTILQQAVGMIAHSEYSRQLTRNWYGASLADNCQIIPLLQLMAPTAELDSAKNRDQSRQALGLNSSAYVICSFGFLSPVKLNHRLCEAWLQSALSKQEATLLIFVGEVPDEDYARELENFIQHNHLRTRIQITGWVDASTYQAYLAAADVAVQLRTQSRGETSAAIIDCLSYGLPLIVNANGAFADLPADAVWLMPDNFSNADLIAALETLYSNQSRRVELGRRGQEFSNTHHSPANCALLYAQAIEKFYASTGNHPVLLAKELAQTHSNIDHSLVDNLPIKRGHYQFLIDISATIRNGLKTGIERMVQALLLQLLDSPPPGYRIEPVYLSEQNGSWNYHYARRYTLDLLNCPVEFLADEMVEVCKGDMLLTVDWSGQLLVNSLASGLHQEWQARGVKIYSVVHDLLPLSQPEVFPPGADQPYKQWLEAVAQFDGAVCVSQTVAAELAVWLKNNNLNRTSYQITWSHHGADIVNSVPVSSRNISAEELHVLEQIVSRPSFLMVGTIEPRKAYQQAIEAFSLLWAQGVDINLIIVGREGWKDVPHSLRRNIPQTIQTLRTHPERGKHLFWLEDADDDCLQKIYEVSTCLVMASFGEGFGLPLIEAAHYSLPVIARDLPVFREIAGDNIFYFQGNSPANLAESVQSWLQLYDKKIYPRSEQIAWLTWKDAARNILQSLFQN